MAPPILVDSDIDWLIGVQKPVSDPTWRDSLLPPTAGLTDCRGRFELEELPGGQPVGGLLHLYSRRNLSPSVTDDWSVGLIYTDYAGHRYPVIRCNSAHRTVHVNRIEGTRIIATPHVHRLTERYQRHRTAKLDGFAEPTNAFSTIDEAVDHLAALVQLTPVGMLWL